MNGEGESNMDINKYFDNYLDITTKDGKTIHIEKRMFILMTLHNSMETLI